MFEPECPNRLDDSVVFDPLHPVELGSILELRIEHVSQQLPHRPSSLQVTQRDDDGLALEAYDPACGARPLRRLVQREIGDELDRALLAGDVVDGDTVVVDLPEDPEAKGLELRPKR